MSSSKKSGFVPFVLMAVAVAGVMYAMSRSPRQSLDSPSSNTPTANQSAENRSAGVAAKPTTLTRSNFQAEVISSRVPVLVDVWAPWCGPCRAMSPIIDQLAVESRGRYKVAKLNSDDQPEIATHYDISALPTVLVFQNGRVVDRVEGLSRKSTLAGALDRAGRL